MESIINLSIAQLTSILWKEDPEISKMLTESQSTAEARNSFFSYLSELERHYFNIYSDLDLKSMHICEKNNAKECIRVLKNIIRTENEKLTGFSALKLLRKLAKGTIGDTAHISPGFIMEFIFLFRGINGNSGIAEEVLTFSKNQAHAQLMHSRKLNSYAKIIHSNIRSIPKGTDSALVREHNRMRRKILSFFNGTDKDWQDYQWHIRHIVSDLNTLEAIVGLSDEEVKGLQNAKENNIPIQITPYYLSLFNGSGVVQSDRAIRAQVLPSEVYCKNVAYNRKNNLDMDFMGEKATSPIPGITRRYPQIVILKPIDTCPQLCVYCQRNWEIKSIDEGGISPTIIDNAIKWISENKYLTEVLITGGDPLMLSNTYLDSILSKIAQIKHIERIRIGTRIPVTLPYRITPELVTILKRYHVLGTREICMVTHFEHPTEVTSEAINAIRMIRETGISIYNQQVFTFFNSHRYETSALRRVLKLAGVDPYYSFNTKGKAETIDFRVPIARLQQERKEEARFLPGMVRTDEPVFNVPKLGKSHLRSWQDHEIIMITPAGERIYRFYPWESRITFVDDYLYTDTSIYDYLRRLDQHNEYPEKYRTIWYYF